MPPIADPLSGSDAPVARIAYGPDGSTIAVGDSDGAVTLWEIEAGAPTGVLLTQNGARVLGVAISPDGTNLASVDSLGRPCSGISTRADGR